MEASSAFQPQAKNIGRVMFALSSLLAEWVPALSHLDTALIAHFSDITHPFLITLPLDRRPMFGFVITVSATPGLKRRTRYTRYGVPFLFQGA